MSRRAALAGLLLILVFDVWLRAHTFGPSLGMSLWPESGTATEPLDCDEAAYAYIGRRIVAGDVMYRDLTENKPPGGYWLYALTVAVGGPNELAIRLMAIPLVLATIGLVWWLALRLAGPAAAVLAAATYAVVSTDPYLFGNGSNLEHAINLGAVAALAALVAAWSRTGRGLLVLSGACLGVACLVKQVAILHAPVFAIALWLRPQRTRAGRSVDLLALAAGFVSVWTIAIGVLVLQGAASDAFEDIVRYGGALATDTPADPKAPPFLLRWLTGNADPRGQLPWPFGATDYLVWWGTGSWPVWLACLPALAWLAFGPRRTAGRRLLAAWTLSAWVQVAMPGLFWQHYYLLPVPGLAAALAIFAADLGSLLKEAVRSGRSLRIAILSPTLVAIVAALGATGWLQWERYLLVAPVELTERYKGGKQWVTLRALGLDLQQRSTVWENPHLYIWGWQSPLHFYSGLDGVSRHFFADPLLKAHAQGNHPLIRPRIERIMADLRREEPALIFCGDPPFPALRKFLEEGYLPSRLVPLTPDGRGLWVERERYGAFETFSTADGPGSR